MHISYDTRYLQQDTHTLNIPSHHHHKYTGTRAAPINTRLISKRKRIVAQEEQSCLSHLKQA